MDNTKKYSLILQGAFDSLPVFRLDGLENLFFGDQSTLPFSPMVTSIDIFLPPR